MHPGHSANYSHDCTILEKRPPGYRSKCGGFVVDWVAGSQEGAARAAQPAPGGNDACPTVVVRTATGMASHMARLSFRLKTFTWERPFDEPWLHALRRARRAPDALLLSFGIWDMQYPPADHPERGLQAFGVAVRRFLEHLGRSLRRYDRRPRLFWLTVMAVTDAKLPEWKRPRMSADLARRYNELAAPMMAHHGVTVIDTFTSGHAHPELSRDGVHSPGSLSHYHAQLFWKALCTDVEDAEALRVGGRELRSAPQHAPRPT